MSSTKFIARNGLAVGTSAVDVVDSTGELLINAPTASKLLTARTISLSGDVVGSVSFDGSDNAAIATTIQADSVALGTDTTGNYMLNVSAGTGVSVSHTQSEGSTATVSIGQAVGTTDNVTFNNVTVSGTLTSDDITSTNISVAGNATITGNLTVSGTTTTINSTTIAIADLNLELARNAATAAAANGAGITVTGPATPATFTYTSADDRWNLNKNLNVTTVFGALSGNASTATALATGRTIAITGDIAYTSGSFDGTGNVTGAATLATVNSNVGTFNNVTVNAKGLVTSASNVSYLTSFTEADTLATVTGRGASTSTASTFSGGLTASGSTAITLSNASNNYITTGTDVNTFIQTRASSTASTGGMSLFTGDSTFATGSAGGVSIYPGLSSTASGANLSLTGGNVSATTSTGGYVHIRGGVAMTTATTAGTGGNIYIVGGYAYAAAGTKVGGSVWIDGGLPFQAGTNTAGNVNIGTGNANFNSTTTGTAAVNIGTSSITTTITGTVKLPTVGTSGFVKLGTGGQLSADTSTYLTTYTDTLATVTGRGATTATVTSFTGGGGDSLPALRITQTAGAGVFNWIASFMNSGINTAGRNVIMLVGQAESSKNTGYLGFNWAAAGSNSNFLTLGLHSVDNVFNIFGSGNVMVGTTTDSGHKLNVSGTFNATGAITGSNFSGSHSGTSSGTNTGDQTNISGTAGGETLATVTGRGSSTSTMSSFNGGGRFLAPNDEFFSFTNVDSDSTHYTSRVNRILTSNGANWVADGKDAVIAITRSNAGTTRGQSIGLTLHNENNTTNAYSPAITFTAVSNSGSYNSMYAAIMGKKTGQNLGVDSNWNKGELHFYAVGDAYVADTPNLVISGTAATFSGTISASNFSGSHSGTSSGTNTGDNPGVTAVTGTAPVVSSGGTTPAISMAAATTSVSGYLTSTDWNTFNNKQPAGSYLTDAMRDRGATTTTTVDTATLSGFYVQNNTGDSHSLLVINTGGSTGIVQQRFHYGGSMEFRNKTDSANWNGWKTVLTSSNYNSYSPTLTGGSASGTWGINISGNSATTSQSTFGELYTNSWFRNSTSNTGLYNQVTTQHLSSITNGWWDMSSTTSSSGIRLYTGGHMSSIRGHVYADTSNNVGFLTADANWGLRVDSSKNIFTYGTDLTVGNSTSSNIYMTDTDETTRRIHCNSNRIGFLNSSNGWSAYSSNNGDWTTDTIGYAGASFRAPIFYDSDDTAYYTNPNSFSQMSYGNFNANPGGRTLSLGTDQTDRVYNDSARASLVINAAYYPHLYINATSGGNTNHGPVLSMTGILTAGGYRRWGMGIANQNPDCFSWGYYDNNTNPHYGVGGTFGYTDTNSKMWLNTGGSLMTTGDMRSPVFYDSNDTGYYLDPNTTGVALRIAGAIQGNHVAWTGEHNKIQWHSDHMYFQNMNNGYWLFRRSNGAEPFSLHADGWAVATGSWRAPLFYDSNDTAYYTDPASTSVMNRISTVRTDNWLYVDNSYGHSVVGKYDSYILQGIWAMGDSYKLTAAGAAGNLYGLAWSHPNAGGMASNLGDHGLLLLQSGSFKGAWGGGSLRTPGDVRAPIFYDYDNTAYYLDPNGTSNAQMNCIGDNGWRFLSNRNTTSDSAPLTVYSNNAGGAIMSFHRGGYYAVNFGLDSDNVMRIGGWSASANRWQLDMSGNMYAAGNITAYSSDVRLKENIVTIDNALSKLHKIRGVYYDWKDIVDDLGFSPIDRHDIGVIAQEVGAVIPQAIKPAPFDTGCDGKSESGENYVTVQMEKIIPLLIEAIKEQQIQIEELKNEMQAMKNKSSL